MFTHSLQCFYKATVFSKATVFYILATLLTFVPPLLIAFRSQGVAWGYNQDDIFLYSDNRLL